MPTLIDTSLWIDFTRARSPKNLKHFIAPFILHPDAHLAEPVAFEILRHATPAENAQLTQQFQTLPMLPTPADLWIRAADLGRACRVIAASETPDTTGAVNEAETRAEDIGSAPAAATRRGAGMGGGWRGRMGIHWHCRRVGHGRDACGGDGEWSNG